ncbi:TonB-dependent receptor [Zobellia uliginosa]|uniref:TonB-dependent receptor n=1 Tax=Zobellia uliginosa TaxID=143224 RepID=UPI0026E433AF|nr:TonB-dependent receptor [Zobellia uliginosa]MDO6518495.1 TonB-dependent receptor [Zobellia uliginosa]
MNKHFTLVLLTVLIGNRLIAQDATQLDTIRQLKEVIITYQADKLTPITFQNIHSKEIKSKSVGQEPSFLLSETPSITNYSDAGNSQGYSYFRLRGIDQTRINMTLDGVPLNEPEDQGGYFSNFPDLLNSVSKIQIQRGLGLTKNGVASYGGSIQLFSPNLRDSTRTTFGLGYGSFNSLRAFGEYNSGIKNRKAIYLRASQVYSDGYKYHSANNSQSVFVSSGLFFDKSTWKINLLAGQQKNEMAWLGVSDSLIHIDRRTNANSNQEKDRFFQSLAQIQNSWQISPSSFLQSSIYYTFLKGNYDFDLNNFLGFPPTEELYNYAFQSNLIGLFSNYSFSKNNFSWTTGFHGNLYNRKHTGSEKELGQLYQNKGFKNEVSAFTKANYGYKWLTFFADIQYRYVDFDYEGSVAFQKLDWDFINPKAGFSTSLNPHSTLYYSIGRTGREPTRNDMFGGNDDLLADNLGKPILSNTKPEYVVNHELGFRYQKKRLNLDFNFYHMDFENEIVLDGKFGPNGLSLTSNVEQSVRTGLELALFYRVNHYFSLTNNSSFNYSRIKEQSEKFTPILTPPLIVNQEVQFNKNNLTLALSAKYQYSSFIDFANEEMVDGYFLMNSRASYDIDKFQFAIFLNNITDTKYFNQGYVDFDGSKKYFVQAPINFYTSIQYNF